MRSVIAKLCGVGVAIVSGGLLYYALLINSLPLDSGEMRWWIPALKKVLYAPTLWMTGPIHQALYLSGTYWPIRWLMFAEIGLLAVLYGVLFHQAIMGKLTPTKIAAWFSRRKVPVAAVAAIMIVGSIAGRVATAQQDFRREVSADEDAPGVVSLVETRGIQVTVLDAKEIVFPEGSEPAAILRTKGEPVSVLLTGNVKRDETNFMSATGDLTMLRLDGEKWAVRKGLAGLQMSPMSSDFRSPSDPASSGVIFLNIAIGNPQLMLPFDDEGQLISFAPFIDSEAGFAAGDSIWVVGLGFGWESWDGPSVDRISAYQHPNFATHSLGVFRLDPATGSIELKGVCDNFTDHSINTLDATLDDEGVMHVVAAEVLIANENSIRVHYLRFDTAGSKWLGDEVIWKSDVFTSTVDTLIRRSSQGIEMFWNLSRSPTVETGGVFGYRAGDPQAFQLTDREDSFLGVLADPSPGIEMLVGRVDPGFQTDRTPGLTQQESLMKSLEANRAAQESNETTVEWYLKQGGGWANAGTTTVPVKLYDTDFGQTGFWLWPGADGKILAAFRARSSMIVQELVIGE